MLVKKIFGPKKNLWSEKILLSGPKKNFVRNFFFKFSVKKKKKLFVQKTNFGQKKNVDPKIILLCFGNEASRDRYVGWMDGRLVGLDTNFKKVPTHTRDVARRRMT